MDIKLKKVFIGNHLCFHLVLKATTFARTTTIYIYVYRDKKSHFLLFSLILGTNYLNEFTYVLLAPNEDVILLIPGTKCCERLRMEIAISLRKSHMRNIANPKIIKTLHKIKTV